jgi:hypothetical protein
MEKIKINGNFISDAKAIEIGFKKDSYSYLVDAYIETEEKLSVIRNCKAIKSSGENETVYFKEENSGIILFTASENPKLTIKKKTT